MRKNRRRLPWFRKHVSWVRKEMKCLWWGKKRPHWGGVIKEEQYEDALASRSSFRLWGWGFGQHCQSKHLHIPPQRTRCEPFTHFLVSPNQHLPSGVASFILSLHCGFACGFALEQYRNCSNGDSWFCIHYSVVASFDYVVCSDVWNNMTHQEWPPLAGQGTSPYCKNCSETAQRTQET